MKNGYAIINPTLIANSMMNNKEMMRQFMTLYSTQIPIDFKKLEDASVNNDHNELSNMAHHILPTMEYIGATEMKDKLKKLELAARNEDDSLEIESCVRQIIADHKQLIAEIKHFLSAIS